MSTCVPRIPAALAAQPVRREDIDEGAECPLECPGEVERADEGADLGRPDALPAQLRGHRRRGEAERDAFGDVEQEKGGKPAPSGREQVG
jgi:hypothetical protein